MLHHMELLHQFIIPVHMLQSPRDVLAQPIHFLKLIPLHLEEYSSLMMKQVSKLITNEHDNVNLSFYLLKRRWACGRHTAVANEGWHLWKKKSQNQRQYSSPYVNTLETDLISNFFFSKYYFGLYWL